MTSQFHEHFVCLMSPIDLPSAFQGQFIPTRDTLSNHSLLYSSKGIYNHIIFIIICVFICNLLYIIIYYYYLFNKTHILKLVNNKHTHIHTHIYIYNI